MTQKEISKIRLYLQQLRRNDYENPKDLLSNLGAVQAQDYNMGKMALAVRLQGHKESDIDKSILNGKILRTHILRPTWHFVCADDIYWMMSLTGPRISKVLDNGAKKMGIDSVLYNKSFKVIEKALTGGKSLSRNEIVELLKSNKIGTEGLRVMYILMKAEVEGLLCNGPELIGKTVSYALLEERVPTKNLLIQEEALSKLASIYFNTRGPATLRDFVWWSGLTVKEAKSGLDAVKKHFQSRIIDDQEFFFPENFELEQNEPLLLPGFDEIIISYKHKTGTLRKEHYEKVISKNAIFKPVIIADGHVVGIWKKKISKSDILIEKEFFDTGNWDLSKAEKRINNYWK